MQYKQIFRHFRWGRSAAVAIIIMVVVIPLATYLLVLQFVWVWNDLLVPMVFLNGVGRGQNVFPVARPSGWEYTRGAELRCRGGHAGGVMDVIDLPEHHESIYFQCLEDWSEEMREAGWHKEAWYRRMKEHGLRVKLACDDRGEVGGMIQYMPAEKTHIDGPGLYFIYCIWVHSYKEGRGDFRGRRMGRAMLRAAEEDSRALGAAGMAAWGLMVPAFMRASWFKRRGYRVADRDGIALLLWKPFSKEARPPRWQPVKKTPHSVAGQVTVAGFVNGWCPAQNMVFERARRAAEAAGEGVVFEPHCTADPEVFAEWGITDAVYVDGEPVGNGPPLSYERLKAIIDKRKRRLPQVPL